MNIFFHISAFILFVFCQAFFINGWNASLDTEMIFNPLKKWVTKVLGGFWSKPIVGCVKCMASFWGSVTYWPVVVFLFGFHCWQLGLFVADVFILIPVTWIIYKKQ